MARRFCGLDFSGARDAGRHAWVSQGQMRDERLWVLDCRPLAELPGSSARREVCLPALARWVAQLGDSLLGCDFPFSLPREVMGEEGWEAFVETFPQRFPTPEHLRMACRDPAGRERRRQTDRDVRAPFAPGNLRLYRQTYYGIRELLSPLVRARSVCVLPFQRPTPGRPWLIEVCPAVTLRRLRLYRLSYKGRGECRLLERQHLLDGLDKLGMRIPARVRSRVLSDAGGNALDSLIALYTAWSVRAQLVVESPFDPEGYIFAPLPAVGGVDALRQS